MTVPHISRCVDLSEFPTDEGCQILESWNDDRDPEASIARARVGPGVTTELHSLRGVTERYVIVEGLARVEVEGLGGWQEIGPGDVVFIPAGVRQRIHNPGSSDLLFYCVCTPRFRPDSYREEK